MRARAESILREYRIGGIDQCRLGEDQRRVRIASAELTSCPLEVCFGQLKTQAADGVVGPDAPDQSGLGPPALPASHGIVRAHGHLLRARFAAC